MSNFYGEQVLPGFVFFAHGLAAPTDAEFSAHLHLAHQRVDRPWRCLVLSAGGSPTLKQRKELDAALQNGPGGRTALVTESAAIRALLTAVAWVTRNQLKTFAPGSFDDALAYLNVTDDERPLLQAAIDRARDKLGPLFNMSALRKSA
jgi:hypothetical protein